MLYYKDDILQCDYRFVAIVRSINNYKLCFIILVSLSRDECETFVLFLCINKFLQKWRIVYNIHMQLRRIQQCPQFTTADDNSRQKKIVLFNYPRADVPSPFSDRGVVIIVVNVVIVVS